MSHDNPFTIPDQPDPDVLERVGPMVYDILEHLSHPDATDETALDAAYQFADLEPVEAGAAWSLIVGLSIGYISLHAHQIDGTPADVIRLFRDNLTDSVAAIRAAQNRTN